MPLSYSPALKGRSLITTNSVTDEEFLELIALARQLKVRKANGVRGDLLARRHIALVFEKSSTRTRSASAIAAADEGATTEYISPADSHFGKKESVKDSARVLGRMYDGILFRGFRQSTVEQLAEFSGVPVWNGLTDFCHPTQVLADLMTVQEAFGTLAGTTFAYVGDGRNNVANSLMMGCAKAGVHFVNCTPAALDPDPSLVAQAREIAARHNATVRVEHDPAAGVRGANVLYTDVWVSMGEEAKREERLALLRPYQVNLALARATGNLGGKLIFLHCLPAFHDDQTELSRDCGALEVTDDVFEAPWSRVFDEAENRMHTIKALFVSALA
jgi:ornithine carbamoyltransferase